MKVSVETLQRLCPFVDARLTAEHLARLDPEYVERFSPREIAAHLRGLAILSPRHPVELLIERDRAGMPVVTVLAFDYPFEFSLITGVLAGAGFSILAGDVFTYRRSPPDGPVRRVRRPPALLRRRIVDRFTGTVDTEASPEEWARELRRRMTQILGLLEEGEGGAPDRAKQRVNEWVTERLAGGAAARDPVLYPVQLELDNDDPRLTRLRVVSQDTPAFLYSLSTALSMHGLSIERVRIRTVRGRVEDELDVVDIAGRPVTDERRLNQVRFSVLFTKQFTYFLGRAPDPYAALSRFEHLLREIQNRPRGGRAWRDFLGNPRAMQDLARLLGASDFLWEDFIRLQYEELLPLLRPHAEGLSRQAGAPDVETRLRRIVKAARSYADRRHRLNEFKDREIFVIDLDHILRHTAEFRPLAERLTALAEAVVRVAAETVYARLVARHGRPCTVAGLETEHAVLGLGKFGGAALGYASDVELMFLYGDSGRTDGRDPIGNDEFFARLAEETASFIEAKREGIFHVDLRLRPYGESGPAACSLESFCRYYGPGGPAHSYERLSLVRLRPIGGDAALGARAQRLRDEFIYATPSIRIDELRQLRTRQFEEKRKGGVYNAKFSPGALVDVEYTVQILQALYGRKIAGLRTPRIHEALQALQQAGILAAAEADRLVAAYDFLRRLVNGLRMLRGSARDLFLPAPEADEFLHLARRMGYEAAEGLNPSQQLYVEFEIHTAAVRAFVERQLGRGALPGPPMGYVADLLLSEEASPELRRAVLSASGLQNVERAYVNLRALAGRGARREQFVRLAVLACDIWRREPDPDMALNNWERFVSDLPDAGAHFQLLLAQPRRLEILLGVFSRSQFLADTLVRNREFLDTVTDPARLNRPLDRARLTRELAALSKASPAHAAWLDALRRFRRRETLRIGIRDLCLGAPVENVTADLSVLADAIVAAALHREWREMGRPAARLESHFCVVALGKLGGGELNYSSDIDLLGLCDEAGAARGVETFAHLTERLHAALSRHTEEGYAYRVDLRLRPHGGSGELIMPLPALADYYGRAASDWELQAMLKARPVAGSPRLGRQFMAVVKAALRRPPDREAVIRGIHRHRTRGAQTHEEAQRPAPAADGGIDPAGADIKNGVGGIRDAEFLVQGLQRLHLPAHPRLFTGNTLRALAALAVAGLLPEAAATALRQDYCFLRRVEHVLQILEDRQTHVVPTDPAQLRALARRVLSPDADGAVLLTALRAALERTHAAFLTFLR